MEQILNTSERNKAFLKFLLLFMITGVLVVCAVFFNFRVPVKENSWLQSQLEIQRTYDANQAKFIAKMDEAVALLDSLDKKETNVDMVKSELTTTIEQMRKLQQNDQTQYGKMDRAIVFKFDELKNAKANLRNSEGNAVDLLKCRTELKECTDRNDRLSKGQPANGL